MRRAPCPWHGLLALTAISPPMLPAPALTAPAPTTDLSLLTIRLLDGDTKRILPGLVRVTFNGQAVPMPGLVGMGTGLPRDHPAQDWYALVEARSISLPRSKLTIEAFSGLESQRARVVVDLSHKPSSHVELRLRALRRNASEDWFSANTHLHLHDIARDQADAYLRTASRANGLDLVFVSYVERANADHNYTSNTYTTVDLERLITMDLRFGNGQEHRHDFGANSGGGYGHVLFLNTRRPIRPVSIGAAIMGRGPDSPPLRRGMQQARADGATIVWCPKKPDHAHRC